MKKTQTLPSIWDEISSGQALRLSRRDRERIAEAVRPRFLRRARQLGFDIVGPDDENNYRWGYSPENPVRPLALHFFPPASKTSQSGFSLWVRINPDVEIDPTRKHLHRLGLEAWFVNDFCVQYRGLQKISNRIGDGLLDWVDELGRIQGAELIDIIALPPSSGKNSDEDTDAAELAKWHKRLANAGVAIETFHMTRDTAIKVTELLLQSIHFDRSKDIYEWLAKRLKRRIPSKTHIVFTGQQS